MTVTILPAWAGGTLYVVIAAVLLQTLPASAKEGLRAKLDGMTVRFGAAPGKTLRIS